MNKINEYVGILAIFSFFVVVLIVGFIDDVDAIKAKGSHGYLSPKSYGSATNNLVCGDRLCSAVLQEEKADSISREIKGLEFAKPSETIELSDEDFLQLEAKPIVKKINDDLIRMYGFNGQIPGPLLKVKQGNNLTVYFTNNIELETTIHWHGLRLKDNNSDGFPYINQEPIRPGESFLYNIDFPDAGIFFYHPHLRGDLQMELGLYGNILVEPSLKNYNQVDLEIPLILDDIKIENGDVAEFSKDYARYTLMGRFGNTMLVNGNTEYNLDVNEGNIVRFYLSNPANSRTFNFSIEEHQLKLVGGDAGKYERESFVESVILGSSERQIIEVLFEKPGIFTLLHKTPEKKYILGTVNVSAKTYPGGDHSDFYKLKENQDVIEEISRFKKYFSAKPDLEIALTLESQIMMERMGHDNGMEMKQQKHYIEWEDEMPIMNSMSTSENTKWILRDKTTGKENFDINYQFKVGDVKKIRILNDPNSMHPMQHPIHMHGQRFLVLSVDGNTSENLVWKDTVLVPTGSTVDILVDFSNTGKWVMHCHILEHEQAGMITVFTVI